MCTPPAGLTQYRAILTNVVGAIKIIDIEAVDKEEALLKVEEWQRSQDNNDDYVLLIDIIKAS